MKKGKKLERLVRLVQEALKDIPDTKIYSNHKLVNESGNKREFDVVIQSCINGFPIQIVIECKDYKRKVSVDKIEAFQANCQRVAGISKKVFVSSKGFQKDAYDSAKYFDIELIIFKNIHKADIAKWFPFSQLTPIVKLLCPLTLYFYKPTEKFSEGLKETDLNLRFHFCNDKMSMLAIHFIWNHVVVPNQREIQAAMLLDFMKANCDPNYKTVIPFELTLDNIYVFGKDSNKQYLFKVGGKIIGTHQVTTLEMDAKQYQKTENTQPDARVASFQVKEQYIDVIIDKHQIMRAFHSQNDGTIYPLKIIGIYDIKKDKFSFTNQT